jgi:hypothetical protein
MNVLLVHNISESDKDNIFLSIGTCMEKQRSIFGMLSLIRFSSLCNLELQLTQFCFGIFLVDSRKQSPRSTCPVCTETFSTQRGLACHFSKLHPKEYKLRKDN